MKNWNQLTIIEKVFVKEKAMYQHNKRIHFTKPNYYGKVLNELHLHTILTGILKRDFF